MKEISSEILLTDKENTTIKMEIFMKENLKMDLEMDKELIFSLRNKQN